MVDLLVSLIDLRFFYALLWNDGLFSDLLMDLTFYVLFSESFYDNKFEVTVSFAAP